MKNVHVYCHVGTIGQKCYQYVAQPSHPLVVGEGIAWMHVNRPAAPLATIFWQLYSRTRLKQYCLIQ